LTVFFVSHATKTLRILQQKQLKLVVFGSRAQRQRLEFALVWLQTSKIENYFASNRKLFPTGPSKA
jgi:hypothetical protein